MINGNHNENIFIDFAKRSKINGYSSVATEAMTIRLTTREKWVTYPKLDFHFLNTFNLFSLQFSAHKKLKTIKKTYFCQLKINEDNCSSIYKTYQNNLPNFYCNRSTQTYHILKMGNLPKNVFSFFVVFFCFPFFFQLKNN